MSTLSHCLVSNVVSTMSRLHVAIVLGLFGLIVSNTVHSDIQPIKWFTHFMELVKKLQMFIADRHRFQRGCVVYSKMSSELDHHGL